MQLQPTQPLDVRQVTREKVDQEVPFTYVVTHSATDKTRWQQVNTTVEQFVPSFVRRGHLEGQKDGTGIVAARMVPASRLEDKNVLAVTAIILDVDGKLRENGAEIVKYVDPDAFLAKLPFRGVAHTSYNHSAELAKFRVILPLAEPVSKDDFLRLWWWAFEECGRSCDPACKNPSRMFYLPRRSAEVDPKLHWIRELEGPLLSIKNVPASFKPSGPGAPLPQKKKTGLHVGSAQQTQYRTVDPHAVLDELLDSALYEWALAYPHDLSREAWRGLATNLGALVVEDSDMYEPCSQAFHDLSKVDDSRYDYGNCERTFRDAVRSAQNVGPMTFETLRMAGAPEDACLGHAERSPVAVARARVSRKVRETTRQAALAKSSAPRTDVTLPPPSTPAPVEVKAAPAAAEPPPAASGGTPPPASGGNSGSDGEDNPGVSHWQDPANFVFDGTQNAWFVWDAQGKMLGPVNDQAFTRLLISYGFDRKGAEGFKALIPHATQRKSFYDRTERIVESNNVRYLNTYVPGEIKPVPGGWDPIKKVLLHLVGNDQNGLDFLLDWIAAPLQSLRYGQPRKMGTAIVFRGAQGSGKGTISKLLSLLYGTENFVELDQDALDSRFNDAIVDKLFVVANEVMSSTNRSSETNNKLKPWITDETIVVERKFQGRTTTPNNFNILFTSNDPRPVIIERTDRRYTVFEAGALDRELAKEVWDDINGRREMVAAFYAALLLRNGRVGYGEVYRTEARQQLIVSSLTSAERFAEQILEDGWLSVSRDWVNAAHPNETPRVATERDGMVSASTLHAVYHHYCKDYGLRPLPAQYLVRALQETLPGIVADRTRIAGLRARVWRSIPLRPKDESAEAPLVPAAPVDLETQTKNLEFA